MVFKNIAEQTYVRKVQLSVADCRIDSMLQKNPPLKNGNWKRNQTLLASLNFPAGELDETADWVKMQQDSVAYHPQTLAVDESLIPDVRGDGARDALYLLEKSGLSVNLAGAGTVVSQSFTPGQRLVKGTTISITLR